MLQCWDFYETFSFIAEDNRCDPIPTAAFATPNSTVASNGSVICYQCNVGYQFPSQTSETIFCDGQNWIGTVSECTGNLTGHVE